MGYLIESYLGSMAYCRLADSTRRDMRGRLDWIRAAIGGAKYVKIEPHHVAALMEKKGAYILNLTGGNPALASVGTNVTQRPMNGKTTLRRPHCN